MSTTERDIGSLDARMSNVENDIKDIKKDVKEIRDLVITIKGGWRGLSIAGAIGGGVAAAALKIGPIIAMLPK